MKPRCAKYERLLPGRRGSALILILGVCAGFTFLANHRVHSADGALDETFVPDPAYPEYAWGLGVYDGEYYFSHPQEPVRRLREDGSLDPDWSLVRPPMMMMMAVELRPTAWGGWVFSDMTTAYLDTGTGAARTIGYRWSGSPVGQTLFPRDDQWVVIRDPVSRVNYDGIRDPRFGNESRYVAASFSDGAGMGRIGSAQIIATEAGFGAIVVAGNFQRVGAMERLGLARILADGTVDPFWNPAPGMGIALDEEGYLNALPESLASGPNETVLVGLRYVSTDGQPNLGLVSLDRDGTVIATFANPGMMDWTTPVVQPDGRVVVGGVMLGDPDVPLPAVVRFNPDGSPDATFSVGVSSASGFVRIDRLDLDELGRLWIAGTFDAVNGAPRTDLARLFAYDPVVQPPSLSVTFHQPRIGTDEFLLLSASVGGVPAPTLQWYRNGVALPGQNHRGLRILVEDLAHVGDFTLGAENPAGSEEVQFPPVTLAERSRRPGTIDPDFDRSLVEFVVVTHLVPLADGSVLVGGGRIYIEPSEPRSMVGKLGPDGHLDPGFGEAGVVTGDGFVESLRLLPDGGILVAGQFTELGGVAASGLAELDANGRLVAREWPTLDVAHVSTALRLVDGRHVIAGRFSLVAGEPAYRLARLNEDLTLDASFVSPLDPWQLVDDVQLDGAGRLLIAGARIFATGPITNPPPVGLQRLVENGSPDPGFLRLEGGIRSVIVEPGGTLLTLSPPGPSWGGLMSPRRLDVEGNLLVEFEDTGLLYARTGPGFNHPDQRMLRFPDGSVLGYYSISAPASFELIRWDPVGRRDYNFKSVLGTHITGPRVQAVALLPGGALLVSTTKLITLNEEARRLVRIPPDADSRLEVTALSGDEFRVRIATQPGYTYEIRRRTTLDSEDWTVVGVLDGDGYVQELSTAADATMLFLDSVRK
jgi:uncharacterized delta-60 repeat protein